MATEKTPGDPATDSTETVDQEATGQSEETQDETTSQTPAEDAEGTEDKSEQDPSKKALLDDLYRERNSRKALQAQVDKLKSELSQASSAIEQRDAVQRRYDRLEEFLSKVGGPLGKALDSKSFTTKLFETDDDIGELVKTWFQDNPTKTNVALSSDNVSPGGKKPSMNDLLRSAMK